MKKRETPLPPLPALLLLFIRGLALWLLIPIAFVFWIVAFIWLARYTKSLPQFISWVDYNFVVSLERGPLRLLIPQPFSEWLPLRRIGELKARTNLNDMV